MEIKQTKPLSQKNKTIITVVCAVVALTSLYCQIFVFPWGDSALILTASVISILTILSIWFKLDKTRLRGFLPVLLLVALMVVEILATKELRKMYIDNQVEKYGVITHGDIVKLYTKHSFRNSNRKMATLAYRVNGQPVYQEISNSNKRISQYDKVKLIYSSENPDVYAILKIEKAVSQRAVTEDESADPNKGLRGVPKPMTFMDAPPQFKGGMPALYAYLSQSVVYPQEARNQGVSGKVFISFVIANDGSVHDVKVEKGIGGGCDEAAIEAVKNMPNWKPGIQNGKPVRVKYNIPISFSL